MALPGADSHHELVRNQAGTPTASGTWNDRTTIGLAAQSTSTSNGGVYWPWNERLSTLTNAFTIVVWARNDALTDYSHLLTIPYSTTWSSPYYVIQFCRDAASNDLQIGWTVGGSNQFLLGAAGGFVTGPLACFATTMSVASANLYRDGILRDTGSGISGTIDLGSKREVILFNRNSLDLGEGLQGAIPYAAIWNRALTPSEIGWVYAEPFAFIKSTVVRPYGATAAPPPTSGGTTRVMMGV